MAFLLPPGPNTGEPRGVPSDIAHPFRAPGNSAHHPIDARMLLLHSLLGGLPPRGGHMENPGGPTSGALIPFGAPTGPIDTGFNPAGYQRAVGNTGQAVADWEAHHPGAMQAGNLPGWITDYMSGNIAQAVNPHMQQVGDAHSRAAALAQHLVRQRSANNGVAKRSLRRVARGLSAPAPLPGYSNTAI